MNSIFRPHDVYVSVRRCQGDGSLDNIYPVTVKGTVRVKTNLEKSTGKNASALDREGIERRFSLGFVS